MVGDKSQARQKRVSDVGGDQASEGGQRVVGYTRSAIIWRRPAKRREQGSGLFHMDGFSKLRNLEAGPSTFRQDEVSPSFASATARRLAGSPA